MWGDKGREGPPENQRDVFYGWSLIKNLIFFRLHMLIVHLHDITARVQNFLRTEYERLGLFEVLCKTLLSLLTSSEELWQTDIFGQDGRSIIKEDVDFLFRFVGLQCVSASGGHGFHILEILLNMLLYMANLHRDIGKEFRQLALNVFNDSIAELLERYTYTQYADGESSKIA